MKRNYELCAAVLSDIQKLEDAIKAAGGNVNVYDNYSYTPLSIAARENKVDAVKLLIANGAWVDTTPDMHLYTPGSPLFLACKNGHTEIARILIEKGASINQPNPKGDTPLHIAIQEGHVECVSLLLMNGANVFAVNNTLETPLHIAALFSQRDSAKLLLDNGAMLTLKMQNSRLETPKKLALSGRTNEPRVYECLSLISEYEIKSEQKSNHLEEKILLLEKQVKELQISLLELREHRAKEEELRTSKPSSSFF